MTQHLERAPGSARHSAPGFGRMEGLVRERGGVQEGRTGGARYDIIIPSIVLGLGLAAQIGGIASVRTPYGLFGFYITGFGGIVVGAGAYGLMAGLGASSALALLVAAPLTLAALWAGFSICNSVAKSGIK